VKTRHDVREPDADKPWETCAPGLASQVFLYGTILFDHLLGKYRMWSFAAS
jgi:hypothetical protein